MEFCRVRRMKSSITVKVNRRKKEEIKPQAQEFSPHAELRGRDTGYIS